MLHKRILLQLTAVVGLWLGNIAHGQNVIRLDDPQMESAGEAVLFPFDNYSVPFRHGVQLQLVQAEKYSGNPVITTGDPGSADSAELTYYGTVVRVGDELRMWYLGRGEAEPTPYRICYAVSKDGLHWTRPSLGLVEYGGNRDNNLVDLDLGGKAMACCVLYEPQEKDAERRFKMFCEVASVRHRGVVAFSADGLRWKKSPLNPVTHARIEPTGLVRRHGCYYVLGQNAGMDQAFQKRVLIVLASYDFERWTDAAVLGFRRDAVPPRTVLHHYNMGPQVHLGAGIWDRGNVLLGLYGQWDGATHTGDRRELRMDLGLLLSQDGMHYREPIPDFKMIDAFEEGWSADNPHGDAPRLAQGQGMANIGDKTLVWYAIWGPEGNESIRAAHWTRDRLGYFSPTREPIEGQTWVPEVLPHFISTPIDLGNSSGRVYVNASHLGETSQITVEVLDERFEAIAGLTEAECRPMTDSSLRYAIRWGDKTSIGPFDGPIRVRVNFRGVRLEDARVYAVYVTQDVNDRGNED